MKRILLFLMVLTATLNIQAAVDPNFYIYLCFGQSNMEGQAEPQTVDKAYVDPRFQMLACVDFQYTSPKRTMGQWYTAYCPLVRDWTKIGMADYFGRTMVAALPSNVKIGVVDVAIGGVDIKGFMSEEVENYLANLDANNQYLIPAFQAYANDPYKRLVDMAKIAQQSGVIKGILLHQGETNTGQTAWLQKVKTVYERLLKDLGLNAADVPLFAGEVVNADVGGVCAGHNPIIAQLPDVIPTAHVIPSNGCPCAGDKVHFTIDGYRTMGKRYAYEALRLMGKATQVHAGYNWNNDALQKVYQLTGLNKIDDITLRVGGSKMLTVWGTFADGHQENLTHEVTFTSNDFTIENSTVIANTAKKGKVTASYTDFLGNKHTLDINVESSDQGPNQVLVIGCGAASSNQWDREAICHLNSSMVIGKTYVIRATIRGDHNGEVVLWPRWGASPNRDQWQNSADIEYLATKNATTTFQEITWSFVPKFTHDELIFAIGKMGGGNVYFDDVSCKEQGGTVEMVPNGSFNSDDISNWEILSWAGMTKSVQEDNTSGIAAISIDGMPANGYIYNLQGMRVATLSQWDNLPHGIYIINGKKRLKE